MTGDADSPASSDGKTSITLSTGQTVTLPLVTEATAFGAVFQVPHPPVQKLLPEGLTPVGPTSRTAAVTLLSVKYHHIGVNGIDPYNEFAVIFPAVSGSQTSLPYVSLFDRMTSGYMWYLPVTTASAKALGVEIWGHPKVVGEITHEDEERRRCTSVEVNGEHVLTFAGRRPPSMSLKDSGYVFTVKDGVLLRGSIEIDGEMGMWPFSDKVTVTFGNHLRGSWLQQLDIGGRTIARVSVDGRVVFGQGQPVQAV
ncbi:acetoacetate decarboxylase family protein [Saliphagus sp. LR7]|uniref:acetoacetate decarboxylase family protein n=1 Tax=Saliphagus sp. LR7 TaxID=2282654 RepID=UPI000DF72C22|nr:acetoacetate decarboxylase family protein [Saliphagus sp. LR7]